VGLTDSKRASLSLRHAALQVSFTRIPYHEVVERAQQQEETLDRLITVTTVAGALTVGGAAAALVLLVSRGSHGAALRSWWQARR
jgi:hypothetical protein